MEQFAYSFAITLMHSVWQMALLLMLYWIGTTIFRSWPPIARRNFLYLVLAAQVFCSLISFYLIYSELFHDFTESAQVFLGSFTSSRSWLRSYAETIFWFYALMVTYRLSSSLMQWMSFSRRYKTGLVKPSVDIRLFTESKAYHFGISRKVRIWYSENIHSPMTFGFWKPVVLLPLALVNQLSLEQTESLVLHELTHIRNNDYVLNWILVISEAIYFFNPFVRIVAQKIRLEREKNCDLQVLQFDYPAISYAETLLQTAKVQRSTYALQLSAVKSKSELLQRVRFFTEHTKFDNTYNKKFPVALMGIAIFLMINLLIAGYFLRSNDPAPTGITGVAESNAFAAPPVNEWNKSFSNGPLTNDQAAPSTRPGVKKNTPKTMAARNTIIPPVTTEDEGDETAVAYVEEPTLFSPVSYMREAVEAKSEIIIKEEVSSGKIVTRFYQLKNVNGEIILEPLWMTAELKPLLADSLKAKIKTDSTRVLQLFPTFQ